jgi:hypothetical protein
MYKNIVLTPRSEISNYYVHIVQENVCLPNISALSLILEHKTLFQPDSEKVILILCYYISLKDRSERSDVGFVSGGLSPLSATYGTT